MRRLPRHSVFKTGRIFLHLIRLDCHLTLILISYESDILDITALPEFLDFCPLDLLWFSVIIPEEHPYQDSYENDIEP